jgi:hypothetical protein
MSFIKIGIGRFIAFLFLIRSDLAGKALEPLLALNLARADAGAKG